VTRVTFSAPETSVLRKRGAARGPSRGMKGSASDPASQAPFRGSATIERKALCLTTARCRPRVETRSMASTPSATMPNVAEACAGTKPSSFGSTPALATEGVIRHDDERRLSGGSQLADRCTACRGTALDARNGQAQTQGTARTEAEEVEPRPGRAHGYEPAEPRPVREGRPGAGVLALEGALLAFRRRLPRLPTEPVREVGDLAGDGAADRAGGGRPVPTSSAVGRRSSGTAGLHTRPSGEITKRQSDRPDRILPYPSSTPRRACR
jgi:hypothetical protein